MKCRLRIEWRVASGPPACGCHPAPRGPVVQTNPICPRRAGKRGRSRSRPRETKPISGSTAGIRGPIVRNKPNLSPRTGRQGPGRSQARETKPNLGRLGCLGPGRLSLTPPAFGPSSVDCAKQTQFPAGSSGARPQGREPGQSCKTKPISDRQADRGAWNRPAYADGIPFRVSAAICFDFRRGRPYTVSSADGSAEDRCRSANQGDAGSRGRTPPDGPDIV
jgi:hypothetical protein